MLLYVLYMLFSLPRTNPTLTSILLRKQLLIFQNQLRDLLFLNPFLDFLQKSNQSLLSDTVLLMYCIVCTNLSRPRTR